MTGPDPDAEGSRAGPPERALPSPEPSPGSRGYVIPIGGAEDKISDRRILQRFVALAGGKSGHVVVIPTASMLPTTGDADAKSRSRPASTISS